MSRARMNNNNQLYSRSCDNDTHRVYCPERIANVLNIRFHFHIYTFQQIGFVYIDNFIMNAIIVLIQVIRINCEETIKTRAIENVRHTPLFLDAIAKSK